MSWVSLPLAAALESETVVAEGRISRAGVRGDLALSLGRVKFQTKQSNIILNLC
jgi:hypothetical protein